MNEFGGLNKIIKEMAETAKTAKTAIDSFSSKVVDKIEDIISNSEVFPEASSNIESIVIKQCLITLENNLIDAIESSAREYDYGIFKERLLRVFGKPEIIRYEKDYIRNRIIINIEAEEVAGNVEEYMEAVRTARPNVSSSEHSSFIWSLIYRTAREGKPLYRQSKKSKGSSKNKRDRNAEMKAKYRTIIEARLNSLEYDKAPYWFFLNYGSLYLGRGGTAYPVLSATNFIEKAELIMNRDVNIELQHEMDRLKSIMKDQIESTTGDSDIKKVGKYFVKSAQSVSNLLPKYAKHYIKEAEMEFIKSKSAVIRSTKKPFRK